MKDLPTFARLLEERAQRSEEIEIPADGISLDLLQAIYRNSSQPLSVRIRCAIAALPHEVPKLAVSYDASEQDFATLLDQRIKRFQEAKLIDAKPQSVDVTPVYTDRYC
jgi:hypothetical protein